MGLIIKTTGEKHKVSPKNGKDYKLKELKDIVDGYIEIVYLQNNEIMVVNEEGLINGLAYNSTATKIARRVYPEAYIVGDVLVCKNNEVL